MASEIADGRAGLSPERAWWLRVPAVLLSPRSVFFALREDDLDDVSARAEPLLLVIWLAGIASVLATPTAADILDDPDYDSVLFAIWAFIAGGLYGFVGYFVIGLALLFGVRLLGSLGDFRRARRPSGSRSSRSPPRCSSCSRSGSRSTAATPSAGAEPTRAAGERVLLALQLAFAVWSLVLLVIGVRTVHGWSWPRSLSAVLGAVALLGAILGVFMMI